MRSFGADNFASGANANYIDHMYSQWEADNSSVHASWHAYFSGLDESGASNYQEPPTLGQTSKDAKLDAILEAIKNGGGAGSGSVQNNRTSVETANLYRLIRAYHSHGHLLADVDPLEMAKNYSGNASLQKKFNFPSESLK